MNGEIGHKQADIQYALAQPDPVYFRYFHQLGMEAPPRRRLVAELLVDRKYYIPEGECNNRDTDGSCRGHSLRHAIDRLREVAIRMDQELLDVIEAAETSSGPSAAVDLKQLHADFQTALDEYEQMRRDHDERFLFRPLNPGLGVTSFEELREQCGGVSFKSANLFADHESADKNSTGEDDE